jgi:hypothetical protein
VRIDLPSGLFCHVFTRYSWDSAAGSPFRGSLRATLDFPEASFLFTHRVDVPVGLWRCWWTPVKKALGPLLELSTMRLGDRRAVWLKVLRIPDGVNSEGTAEAAWLKQTSRV